MMAWQRVCYDEPTLDALLLFSLPFLGFFAGAVGALIGAGGGFILVPILLTILPEEPPGIITGMSQSMVLFTGMSATYAYAKQQRIEYRWAGILAATGLAGMALGAFIVENLSRGSFQVVFGIAALIVMGYLLIRPVRGRATLSLQDIESNRVPLTRRRAAMLGLVGLTTGTMGGLLGIGGGVALVPILVQVFVFPAHLATATSQLVILLTSPAAILVHIKSVPLQEQALPIGLLIVGAILGAQVGARLSRRISAPWLVRTLAVGVGVVGLRLILTSGAL